MVQTERKGNRQPSVDQSSFIPENVVQINYTEQLSDRATVLELIRQGRILRNSNVVIGGGGAAIEQYHVIVSPVPWELVDYVEYPEAAVDTAVMDVYANGVRYRPKSFFVEEDTGRMIRFERFKHKWKVRFESFVHGLRSGFRK